MGTSKIWLFPFATGTVTEIDLGETLSDLQFNPVPNQAISEGMSGKLAQTQFQSKGSVRVVHERFTSAALARQMYLVEKHLKQGGLISLAIDSDQAWAGYTTVVPTRGANTISVHGQVWPYNTSAQLNAGAELEVLSSQPYARREFVTNEGGVVTGGTGPVTTSALEFAYRDEGVRWTLLRHRGFWPILRLSKENRTDAIVTHDHRISYTFDARLEEAIDRLDELAVVPTESVTTTNASGGFRGTLEPVGERPVQTGFGPGVGFFS